jgi:8-oxo-dGTP pyrophosphatase MutT (NUDIX family)
MTDGSFITVQRRVPHSSAITSYGIVVYTINKGELYYLLGQVRDTIAYREFIWNKIEDNEIPHYINLMSKNERQRILENNYQDLINDITFGRYEINNKTAILKNSSGASSVAILEKAFNYNKEKYKENLLKGKDEEDWIFPQGRPKVYEKEIKTALREFEEETRIKSKYITIHKSHFIEETYYGNDRKLYRSVYFIGYIDYNDFKKYKQWQKTKILTSLFRESISYELSQLRWVDYQSGLFHLNPSKNKVLMMVNSYLIFKLPRKRINRRHSI